MTGSQDPTRVSSILMSYLKVKGTEVPFNLKTNKNMRSFILENDPSEEFIPQPLRDILKTRFLDNRHYVFNASQVFAGSLYRFITKLDQFDNLVGQTNFHKENQIEAMAYMLIECMKLRTKLNVYIVLDEEKYGSLDEAFKKYLDMPEPFHTPAGWRPERYKSYLNEQIGKMLDFHCVLRMVSDDPEDDKRLTLVTMGIVAPAQAS